MNVESILLIVGAYLLGSVSSSYLAGRWMGGKDLRQYGSGNLGGSMVWEHVGRWVVVPVLLFDLLKAITPTWLALRLGLGLPVAAVAGLAAVAGHCWSIYLRFTGGRGLLSYVGVLLVLYPIAAVWMVGVTVFGFFLGDSAPWALASLVTMPLLAYLVGAPEALGPLAGYPEIVTPLATAMTLLAMAKRLEANRRPLPPPGPERRKVLLRRAISDRDIADHKAWIDQGPDEDTR
jgi:glycerol-3-phosphate acyltransferase PlsY